MSLPLPRAEVFPFFASAENLARITPPAMGFRLLTVPPIEMHEGTLLDYTIRIAGVRLPWTLEMARPRKPR
jgi:hypothetical protein